MSMYATQGWLDKDTIVDLSDGTEEKYRLSAYLQSTGVVRVVEILGVDRYGNKSEIVVSLDDFMSIYRMVKAKM